MITMRAYIIGIVGFCFYLIAFVNTLPSYYYALTWLTLGVVVSSFGIAVLSIVGLRCSWRVARTHASESLDPEADDAHSTGDGTVGAAADYANPAPRSAASGALVEVSLSNLGSISKTGLVVELRLACERREEIRRRRFVVESLAAGSSIEAALLLRDLPRGRYRVIQARIIGSDVLGLFRLHRRAGSGRKRKFKLQELLSSKRRAASRPEAAAPEIVIGPATVAVQDGTMPLQGSAGEGRDATRLNGISDDVGGTRAYVPGDDLRHVHWKSTARLDQLVVKEYHRTTQLQSAVIWDGAAQTTWGSGAVTSTEWGLRLVASLCRALIEAGRPCDLLRLDSQPLLIALSARVNNPEATLGRAVEALADAVANREMSLSTMLSSYLGRLESGSTAYLVTASLSPDVQRAVEQLRGRGIHVTVGVIDGSAFLWSTDDPQSGVEGARTQQSWRANADNSIPAAQSPVTPDAYRSQVRLLRSAGVPVVLIPAQSAQAGKDFAPPLRASLHELMRARTLTPAAHRLARIA
ncbi:MAG TPA: DUF58 domain-containing protein [Abditibacteriaceae bacterium]|nr:DUF58 domain-containing protein [Abditibacteriaceae bacterium]